MSKQETDTARPAAANGVAAVDRALSILAAFTPGEPSLTLAELAARTGIYKSTILRLAQSLIRGRLLIRLDDGQFQIGSEAMRLNALYQERDGLNDLLLPRMRQLAKTTGESVVFYERDNDIRFCRLRVESDQPIRHHVREGEVMPLKYGSAGRVLLAFSGEKGEPYETIRNTYFYVSLGERVPDTAAVATPILGPRQKLVGSLCVSGPSSRLDAAMAARTIPSLLQAAQAVTRDIGGDPRGFDGPIAKTSAEIA
ncbi:MAG TPA: IclR family transcriptional regulator [Devosiaceae bacterium]|jgi:DNA-binding IclR family transcriptional regulator